VTCVLAFDPACVTNESRGKLNEQWHGDADDEVAGVAAVRTAAKGKPLDCTGRHRAFETVTIAPGKAGQSAGLMFVTTGLAKENSSAVLEATMFTQGDYGYGYGVFHL
jgi:hypothetical protein